MKHEPFFSTLDNNDVNSNRNASLLTILLDDPLVLLTADDDDDDGGGTFTSILANSPLHNSKKQNLPSEVLCVVCCVKKHG
jgi:hypothetical protein